MPDWKPGQLVNLHSDTLQVRSLLMSDIIAADGGEPTWYGSEERRDKVWSPKMASTNYLTGLIGACEQQKMFAFLLVCLKSQRPVGFAKAQLIQESGQAVFIPTIVIGDEADQGARFGVQAALLLTWFAFSSLRASQIALRIYEDNAVAIRRAEQFHFTHQASHEESHEHATKKYRDYRLTLEKWRLHFATQAETYRSSSLEL